MKTRDTASQKVALLKGGEMTLLCLLREGKKSSKKGPCFDCEKSYHQDEITERVLPLPWERDRFVFRPVPDFTKTDLYIRVNPILLRGTQYTFKISKFDSGIDFFFLSVVNHETKGSNSNLIQK